MADMTEHELADRIGKALVLAVLAASDLVLKPEYRLVLVSDKDEPKENPQ